MGIDGPEIHDSPVDYSEDPKFIVGCYEEASDRAKGKQCIRRLHSEEPIKERGCFG